MEGDKRGAKGELGSWNAKLDPLCAIVQVAGGLTAARHRLDTMTRDRRHCWVHIQATCA